MIRCKIPNDSKYKYLLLLLFLIFQKTYLCYVGDYEITRSLAPWKGTQSSQCMRCILKVFQSGLQPSFSHHSCCWTFILYASGLTYSLTSTPSDRFLRNFFMAGLFTFRVLARNLLRGNRRRNIFFYLLFWYLTFDTNKGFTSNKPTHYLLDYDDAQYLYENFLLNWKLCIFYSNVLRWRVKSQYTG